jgi:hypothetical protein
MSFEARIVAFSERFLAQRTFDLVVAPALADLDFDPGRRPLARITNRLAVMKAVAGGVSHDFRRDVPCFAGLTFIPAAYYFCLLTFCFDAFTTTGEIVAAVGALAIISAAPALVCFWPPRRSARPTTE